MSRTKFREEFGDAYDALVERAIKQGNVSTLGYVLIEKSRPYTKEEVRDIFDGKIVNEPLEVIEVDILS